MESNAAENRRLAGILEGLPHSRILVVGDLILDRYADGKASRVSPEAPVLVFDFASERYLLGGACNVAAGIELVRRCVDFGREQADSPNRGIPWGEGHGRTASSIPCRRYET